MNDHPVFDSARELLSQGDTGRALKTLIAHLEQDGSQPDYLRSLRLIEANFNAVRQQEIKGILDFSDAKKEYARTTDALLTIIEALQSGQVPSIGFSGTGDGRRKQPAVVWLLGGGILLLVGIVIGMWHWNREKPPQEPEPSQLQCPKFQPEGFKIMHENRLDLAEKWLNRLEKPNERENQWKKVLKTMAK